MHTENCQNVCIFRLTLLHISSICHGCCRKIINLQPYAAKIDYICPIGLSPSNSTVLSSFKSRQFFVWFTFCIGKAQGPDQVFSHRWKIFFKCEIGSWTKRLPDCERCVYVTVKVWNSVVYTLPRLNTHCVKLTREVRTRMLFTHSL